MPSPHWERMFACDVSPLEIFARGSLMYLSLFVMLRVVLKRQSGTFGLSDMLLIVLLADAAQNGMAGAYRSVPDGLVLVGTLVFWNYALDYLGYRFKAVERFTHPAPLKLIEDGRLLRRNMRRELITMDELMSQLREAGVESPEEVKAAYMEGDGEISVIRRAAEAALPGAPTGRSTSDPSGRS